jgi:hypothetical protein
MYGEDSTREVQDIIDRCKDCGQAVAVSILACWTNDKGAREANLWAEQLPHTKDQCRLMRALDKETWPSLF